MHHILHAIVIALENGEDLGDGDSTTSFGRDIVLFGVLFAIFYGIGKINTAYAKHKLGDRYRDPY